MLKYAKCRPIIGSRSTMVVEFVGVKLVVVRLMVSYDVLTKSAYSLKTES